MKANDTSAGTELEFTGTERIATTKAELWRNVSDPAVLATCIPGAESVERVSDREYEVEITRGITRLTISISGNIELVEMNEPNWILAEGTAYDSRTASEFGGTAAMELTETDDDVIELSYEAYLTFTGGTGSLTPGILRRVVESDVDRYFGNVKTTVESDS
ncbi:CoxG family protein [Halorubrum sp. DTA98]|uniref:CoxG family protein n=1 Tax=Halorubrum sp. DTA98 TaxID=3402163 RepID=UPI003AADD855